MYTYLAIERTPGFLKTEIVVQILVREVAAFKRDIIAAILQTIAQCQVMGELVCCFRQSTIVEIIEAY